MKTSNLYCAYYRVSTGKQGINGLGIDAQREQVENFIKYNGNKIIQEFVEVESGRKNHRPELTKAIEYCKLNRCTLVVARLDRLSRDLYFISSLMNAKVDFVCADLPDLNTLTIGIFASLAQYESELISKRTKAALQQAKLRGVKLGKIGNLKPEHMELAHKRISQYAREAPENRKAFHYASRLKENGMTLRAVAGLLNSEGYRTRRGFMWTASGVKKMLALFEGGTGEDQATAK